VRFNASGSIPRSPSFFNMQRHDGIRLETGPHHSVHGSRHCADDRVANPLSCEELGDVSHQQRSLARCASPHFVPPRLEGVAGLPRRHYGAAP
jgi:hypothetical protein